MSRFYLTTAIDYVNSRPHLGTAYEKITADVIARYKRLCGVPTHFLMGNDEHSQNVYRRAREQGLDPVAYCDQMEQEFRDVWGRLDVSFDDFIRTTEERHRIGVSTMVQRIADRGDLYDAYYEGPYCVSCEAFKPEKDLIDGLCPVHGTKPEWIKEKNHFFRLSNYRDRLLEHFHAHPEFLQPEVRRNEILRLLEGGLDDISISRAGTALGHPPAVRLVERCLRLVRCADQLRLRRRIWPRPGRIREVVAGRPPRDWKGHHALPLRDLAGDADERGDGASAPGLRPRIRPLQGPEDEQVARDGPRPDRRGLQVRRGPSQAVPGEGDSLRAGRRFLVGAVRGAVQRRSREQPREPGEQARRDDREVLPGPAARGARDVGPPARRGRGCRSPLPACDGHLRPPRGGLRRVRPRGRRKRVHRRNRAVDAGEAGAARPGDAGSVGRGGSRPDRCRAAPAGDARFVRRDPAADGRWPRHDLAAPRR